ncbi:glycosyltransferase 52 family protein [Vibrio albus]|uniref:Glycosyltransferase 52 family protein n=1 Tax=Vibrio albus TaxID=2200953 RepID=A0A2U3B8I5_9VIBR|nr:glycosyltransferase 52 family protein [Vibrio albus]PWI33103.1 glycosyltransferase 52 family protein [Vibrio albus]
MNLFLVTSPFQYICAIEAMHQYRTKNNILLLVNQASEPGITQQKNIINESDWDHIIHIGRTKRSKYIPKAIHDINKITKNKTIQHLFHAEYNAWRTKLLLRNLPIIKEVYFDDGTLTINEYEEYIRPKTIYNRQRLLQDLEIKLRGCSPIGKLPQSDNLEIFTIFDIPNPEHPVIKNNLTVLKNEYNVKSLYNPKAPIGFIGQGAIGHKRRKTITQYINEINHFKQKFDSPIIYFPHRTESEEVRKQVERISNLSYHYSQMPLEIELINQSIELSGLVGVLSTVQYTALLLYPNMPIYNLLFASDLNNDGVIVREKRISELFSKSGIINIEIN